MPAIHSSTQKFFQSLASESCPELVIPDSLFEEYIVFCNQHGIHPMGKVRFYGDAFHVGLRRYRPHTATVEFFRGLAEAVDFSRSLSTFEENLNGREQGVKIFVKTDCVIGLGDRIKPAALFRSYCQFCFRSKIGAFGRQGFYLSLLHQFPHIRRTRSHKATCFLFRGIGLANEEN